MIDYSDLQQRNLFNSLYLLEIGKRLDILLRFNSWPSVRKTVGGVGMDCPLGVAQGLNGTHPAIGFDSTCFKEGGERIIFQVGSY